MAAAILRPTVIKTTYYDGTPRHWGVCERCGTVDELAAAKVPSWDVVSLCETCEDDKASGLFDAERPEEEAGWFDWARPTRVDNTERSVYDARRDDGDKKWG